MLTTFALATIARALGETPEQGRPMPKVGITSTPRLIRTIQRFESLWKSWAQCLRVQQQEEQHPELEPFFTRTARVMISSSIVFSNIKMKAKKGNMEIASAPLVEILKKTRSAIISSQKITHIKALKSWVLAEKLPPRPSSPGPELDEYNRRKLVNDRAKLLHKRRKRPVQCCMYVALALFQLLYPEELHDFVAEYENELVRECFDRALWIDDAKTYEQLQLKGHCRARLTPPQDKIPKAGIPFGEISCTPRFVRNPMACGAPIVTNQVRSQKNEQEYINLNRNNKPQHLGVATRDPDDPLRKGLDNVTMNGPES
ncbi:hypothetical protein AK830_g6100 [Neonectria ditissima]|uniref:Uncharacterized protein n=1 Tax=Neonectria ditissima TaxID=78410 RepID=A0A0P7ARM5_9HYPO|nr:hypothetical protein AK830_g6100 [Neonectria ditissima]